MDRGCWFRYVGWIEVVQFEERGLGAGDRNKIDIVEFSRDWR